uniref:NUF2 component of NDC80 kinetochore complex n=1 Tax=Leptobrachium leishanense TaxID=445787 RepID=A0A8C5PVF8_9ANUR
MSDKLTFPSLPANDLVNFFQIYILTGTEAKNLCKNDIFPNPKPEVIQRLFMRVLQLVFNYGVERFYMVPVNLDSPYPELQEGFAAVANIINLMARFLPMCQVYDFSASDILNPKGKRTLHLLSGIVNFIHFRDIRKEVYSEFCQSYKSALDKKHQLQKTIQEAEAKLEKLLTVPPEQQAEYKALTNDIHGLQQTSQEYQARDMSFKDKISQQKADFAEKNKKLSQINLAITTMKEEQEHMKSQIVESPEQRKSKMERMKDAVHKLKQSRQETSEKGDYYREKVSLADQWQSDMQGFMAKLQNIDGNLEMCKKIREETRRMDEQVVNLQLELKMLSSEDSQLKRAILLKKEKLAKFDIKHKKKEEDFGQQKGEVLEICSHIQEKRQAVHGRVALLLQEIQQISSHKDQILQMAEEEKQQYQEVLVNFKAALEKYHDGLQKAFDSSAEIKREKTAELERRMSRR